MRPEELVGPPGKQADGKAKTREGKLVILWSAESRDAESRPLDQAGIATFTVACFLLVAALIRGNDEGWGSPQIVAALAGALGLLIVFVLIELRSPGPMLDVRLFAQAQFTGTAIVAFAQSFALYPMLLFIALWMQDVLGFGALETGLRRTAAWFVTSRFAEPVAETVSSPG